jgi:hypothetical protein
MTAWGFRPGAGPFAMTGLLPPGAAASICFHEPGSFDYRVEGLDRPLEGKIVVAATGPAAAQVGSSHAEW